ncbi:hypothetical protein DPMN_110681 [Dreissena polymorpha]|uniref:Uncharacterized protein n=1 Tax=Dreissena polymorpha TaxID=45954 RepID=A0A9D4KDM7_DREPO|nr:hypothetical protein DPMN_110681 [Dreissena polymorpha]
MCDPVRCLQVGVQSIHCRFVACRLASTFRKTVMYPLQNAIDAVTSLGDAIAPSDLMQPPAKSWLLMRITLSNINLT